MASKTSYETIYKSAHDRYDQAEALIHEMSGARGEEFFRTAMRNFDIVLQCMLYRAAIADRKYEKSERLFLKDITDYTDVPALVRAKSFVTRFHFPFGARKKQAFFEELDRTADLASTAFVTPFAEIDGRDRGRDFLAELEHILLDIFIGFAGIDGDDVTGSGEHNDDLLAEFGALGESLGEYFTAKWEYIVSAYDSNG